MVITPAILYLMKGTTNTGAQAIFRIGLWGIGVAVLVVLAISRPPPDKGKEHDQE